MFNANTNSHYKTLKGWTKSAEYSRAKLAEQVKESSMKAATPKMDELVGGAYKVRMEGSDTWQIMMTPPSEDVVEWLYINGNGVPIYFWKKGQDGLTII